MTNNKRHSVERSRRTRYAERTYASDPSACGLRTAEINRQGLGKIVSRALNVSACAIGSVCGGPKETIEKRRRRINRQLLSFPLFSSFFRHHQCAQNQEGDTEYTKTDSKWQRQVFEEIAGKADTNDIFTEISDDFSDILPGFLVKKVTHNQLLSMKSVGERQWERAAVNETDGFNKAVWWGICDAASIANGFDLSKNARVRMDER